MTNEFGLQILVQMTVIQSGSQLTTPLSNDITLQRVTTKRIRFLFEIDRMLRAAGCAIILAYKESRQRTGRLRSIQSQIIGSIRKRKNRERDNSMIDHKRIVGYKQKEDAE